MKFHRDAEDDNPHTSNIENDSVNRKTMNGIGIQRGDMFTFKGKVMLGKIRKRWKCLLCEFGRSRYGWDRVFCHVEAEHGYKSRGNDRWAIPENERYTETKTIYLEI